MKLTECFLECEAAMKRGSASFYHAFRYLPSPKREAVHVIYAFCRMIDDSVDEPEQSPYTLAELEAHLNALDQVEGHYIWPALRWLFANFPVTKEPFYLQMQGQRRDLVMTQYSTLEELESYCYLVAGTVGEMLLPVLHDASDEDVVRAGIQLGKAMQIVNIVRDIGEDLGRGRRYVPLELLEKHGYAIEAYEAMKLDAPFRAVIDELGRLASLWFGEGLKELHTYPESSAFAIELAASYYGAILGEVKRNRYQVFTKRAVVSPYTKLKLLTELRGKHRIAAELRESGAVS
ncbi:phytoene synthase [Paenibacillus phyllosphaerae]|uniref:Phytoene synthase n=1 Tax=Paenibacillus phyllosphaerae TaxID=274593 RepID=A0A7W5B286_9BACL|nr:phytoene/squalene synthase family protein [Paenibacillus phyllosphaerae]MBB3112892.1 phytoene synthase [Paenibacillus phyllosphaerae]